jgi:3-oxoacyl-[acyl-carrier-protein] synthase II
LLDGRRGGRRIEAPWAADLPVQIAAPAAVDPAGLLTVQERKRLDRSSQFALVAAREAWEDAGHPEVPPERLGVVVGTGIGGVTSLLDSYDVLRERGPRRLMPITVTLLMPNGPAGSLSIEFGAKAGAHTPISACASGAEAIAYGADMIRTGRADVVIAGGTEAAIHQLPLAAFAAMQAVSRRNDEPEAASRPFDKSRDGFLLGEGAGIVILESAAHAHARSVTVYGEVAGAGYTSDAHHIAQPDPTGQGAARALRLALEHAGASPHDVVHINAHATSTPVGDVAEVTAIRAALGDAADGVVVTSTKSMTGHLLGAAGAVESIITLLALRARLVPPTANLDDLDDEVTLDIARGEPRPLPDGPLLGLNNSFGFGGHNVALALRTAP